MASEMPPAAEQPTSLLAKYNKRFIWRLATWGGAAALSLAAAVIVSQTGFGNKRLQLAFSGSERPGQTAGPEAAVDVATAPVNGTGQALSDVAAAKLTSVERNTAATRAETERLAKQVNKLTADSFRFTGRLANLEHQIDGITGSIKQQAEKAAADAVARALPTASSHDSAFDRAAPSISAPTTTLPKLSLLMPPTPGSGTPLVRDRDPDLVKPAPIQDVTVTSAIDSKLKDQATPTMEAKALPKGDTKSPAKNEAKMDPDVLADAAVRRAEETKAEVAAQAKKSMPEAEEQIALEPEANAKMERKAAKPAPTKMASLAALRHRRISRRWSSTKHGYGVDLGRADSVTVVKAQWAAVKANFGPMLVGLHPTAVRDHRLLSGGAFRLVIGRVRSLKAAERLCTRFAEQQVSCRPIQFDGEQVIWR